MFKTCLKHAQAWPKHGPNMAQTWSKHGPTMVQTWPKHGPNMIQTWSKHGPNMVQTWAKHGPNQQNTQCLKIGLQTSYKPFDQCISFELKRVKLRSCSSNLEILFFWI